MVPTPYELQPDGKSIYPFGTKAEGMLMVDADGRHMIEIYADVRPKLAKSPTADDYKAAFLNMTAQIGRAEVNDADRILTLEVAHSAVPDRDLTTQRRPYTLEADVITFRVPEPKARS